MHDETTPGTPVPRTAPAPEGTPLSEVTFVVVDLETTGGSAADSHITEIGAVKVRAGEVLGEFHTLVDPGVAVPPFIRVLTGITDEMLLGAPRIDDVLPRFLEFARGAVLVAHNAPFDIGFLRTNAHRLGLPWPAPPVVDTVALARRLVTRDEVANHKLATLAAHFGTAVEPDHRALHDARATVDVLHGLLALAGGRGPSSARTLEDLQVLASQVHPVQRRRRHLLDGLPAAPGAYLFVGADGTVLHVGAADDVRRRIRSYVETAGQRARTIALLQATERVVPIVCATPLEARVRRVRLREKHRPRHDERQGRTGAGVWVKLTTETFPRFALVTSVKEDGATYWGPFARRAGAVAALDALHEVLPLRRCTTRLSASPVGAVACVLADLGRCGAPCVGRQSVQEYGTVTRRAVDLVRGLDRRLLDLLLTPDRSDPAPAEDGVRALVDGLTRAQRLAPLAAAPEIVAARRRGGGGWEVVSIRHGRLAGTVLTPPGVDPMPLVSSMRAEAETVPPPVPPAPAAAPEETELLLRWLTQDGVRLVDLVGTWSSPVRGAEGLGAPDGARGQVDSGH